MATTSGTDRTEIAAHLRVAVARTARRLRQEADGDLSPAQTSALAALDRHGALTPSELAAMEGIQRPTATRLLARLDDEGLIVRSADPSDRRSALITLSAHGLAVLNESRTRKNAFLAQRLGRLTPEELATLDRATTILEGLLREEVPTP